MINNKKKNIETLAEVFQICYNNSKASSIDAFLKGNDLSKLLTSSDLQRLIDGKACFSKETVMAVYGLLPLKFRFNGIELNLFPQAFYRLNHRTGKQDDVAVINISLSQADAIYQEQTNKKLKFIKENMNHLRHENEKAKNPQSFIDASRRYYDKLSEQEKKRRNENRKLQMKQYREAHPESIKINNQKAKERLAKLSEIEKLNKTIQNRLRCKKYRETHKEEIAARNKLYLAKLDPEILRQRQRKYNQSEKRKESAKAYYEAHKQDIILKAKNNPQTKINQHRYKAKIRFQKRTGTKILSLLQALAEAKSR